MDPELKPALDGDACYRALCARAARFDGVWFVGVTSTGIYCRPVCRARTPRREHCEFFPSAAAAERRGYRPCLRCRPELSPGRAPVDAAARIAAAVAARITEGALDDTGVEALAAEFGLSSRQIRRIVLARLGVAPVALAQTQRLLTAKQLLTDTALPIVEVALSSGFTSVRRFNALFRARYGLTPTRLRTAPGAAAVAASDTLRCRLPFRPPLALDTMFAYLGARAFAGAEAVVDGAYVRAVRLGGQVGYLRVSRRDPDASFLDLEVSASLAKVLPRVVARARWLFDLDAEPVPIAACLGADALLAPWLAARPGLRVPGAFCGFELALRALLGQQVSVRAATTLAGRLVERFGAALAPAGALASGLVRTVPTAAELARVPVDELASIGLPRRRAEAIKALSTAVASGALRLQPSAPVDKTVAALEALPGVGPWTAQYVALRALRAPDAFPSGDLAVQRRLAVKSAREAEARAAAWCPFRGYAVMHLWCSE